MVDTSNGARAVNPLQALIREHMENTGDTLADIAARGGLPRQTVSGLYLRTQTGGIPRRATLDRLAIGLGLSAATVAEAAGKAAAAHVDDSGLEHRVKVLTDLAARMEPAQVDVLLVTARALARVPLNGHDAHGNT